MEPRRPHRGGRTLALPRLLTLFLTLDSSYPNLPPNPSQAGAALYVALQGARNSAQCRAVARRARQRAEAAILHARQQLSEVQAAQEGRDRCLASLQQATRSPYP